MKAPVMLRIFGAYLRGVCCPRRCVVVAVVVALSGISSLGAAAQRGRRPSGLMSWTSRMKSSSEEQHEGKEAKWRSGLVARAEREIQMIFPTLGRRGGRSLSRRYLQSCALYPADIAMPPIAVA